MKNLYHNQTSNFFTLLFHLFMLIGCAEMMYFLGTNTSLFNFDLNVAVPDIPPVVFMSLFGACLTLAFSFIFKGSGEPLFLMVEGVVIGLVLFRSQSRTRRGAGGADRCRRRNVFDRRVLLSSFTQCVNLEKLYAVAHAGQLQCIWRSLG